jgi:para-nitrobenzyl esterase
MAVLRNLPYAAVVALTFGSAIPAATLAQDAPFVATANKGAVTVAQGDLLGFVDNGIYTYRGVPYAKAARFMAPEAPDKWEGLRLAMNYGEICPYPTMTAVANDEQFNPHRYLPENEACQFLNIWTPGVKDDAKRPVMVWLHGGGFTNGSSIEGTSYEGANLARSGDVVVVSLNHRLNILGTLDLSAYGERYSKSANTGMRDIVAALEWVQANIAQFGGDPENVTIFGQSGGGGKVRFLMGTPSAVDLFDKSVVQSGASGVVAMPQDLARAISERTVANLGLTAETIEQIETVPYDQLLAAGDKALKQVEEAGLAKGVGWRPVIDGSFMPEDPVTVGWAKFSADKPLLIGNVLHENGTIIGNKPDLLFADNMNAWTPEHTTEKIAERFGDKAEAMTAAWKEAYPGRQLSELYFWDSTRRQGVVDMAELKAGNSKAPVYSYVFAWNSPVLDGIGGAWHVSEVPHVFNNIDLVPQVTGGGADAKAMARAVSQAWVHFARDGNPNHPGLPHWPAFTGEGGATMIFDNYSTVRDHHDDKLLEIVSGRTGG